MEHVVHIIRQKNEVRDIVLDESVALVAREVRDIIRVSGDEVVDTDHAMPFRQQAIGKV